jgi:hypothetical protein
MKMNGQSANREIHSAQRKQQRQRVPRCAHLDEIRIWPVLFYFLRLADLLDGLDPSLYHDVELRCEEFNVISHLFHAALGDGYAETRCLDGHGREH